MINLEEYFWELNIWEDKQQHEQKMGESNKKKNIKKVSNNSTDNESQWLWMKMVRNEAKVYKISRIYLKKNIMQYLISKGEPQYIMMVWIIIITWKFM